MLKTFFKGLKIDKRISMQIMRAIVFVNILTLILVMIVLFSFFRSVSDERALEMAQVQLEANVQNFNEEIERIESATKVLKYGIESDFNLERALSEGMYLEEYNEGRVDQLRSLVEQEEFSISVYVFFNHGLFGRVVDAWLLKVGPDAYERQEMIPLEYYDQYWEWYNVPIEDEESVWTFPYVDIIGNSNEMIISSHTEPIIVNNQVVGLAGMDMRLSDIALKLNESKLYDTGELYLLHKDGRTIIHPDYEFGSLPKESHMFDQWLELITHDSKGVFEYEEGSDEMVVAFSHLNNEWIIATIVPKNEVFDVGQRMLLFMLLILLISIVASTILANLVGKRISKPIEIMNEAFAVIGGGDLTYTIPEGFEQYGNEIGSLAKTAELMRFQLEQAFNSIQTDNEALEAIVEQRTKKIIDVNSELKASLKKLEDQQLMLIEADRYKTSRFLIQNLAHRLNTPISSIIMAMDFMSKIIEEEGEAVSIDSIVESINIVQASQKVVKDIVDSLNHLLEPYDNVMFDKINLRDAISIGIYNFSYDAQYNLTCDVAVDEDIFVLTPPVLMYKLIQQMLIFATEDLENVKDVKVAFEAVVENEEVILIFKDYNGFFNDDPTQFFTPFKNNVFQNDATGMDLFIMYDMVIRGMDANIEIRCEENSYLEVYVYLSRV